MAKNNSIIISTLITLAIIGSGLIGYYFFADSFTKKIESLSVKYYHYSLKKDVVAKDVSSLPDATAVPVLMYHGVVLKKDSANTTLKNFRKQMEALKKEGFETISVEEFDLFRQGKFVLPKKPIIITFDDGRKDSFYTTDDIFAKLGFKATLFLASGPMLDGNHFYLTEEELQKINESGRWEIQAHGRYSHNRINLDINKNLEGEDQTFLSSKIFIKEENRFETDEEFKSRAEQDYIGGNSDVRNIIGEEPQYFAVPMNDYGISENTNFPESLNINKSFVKKYYKIAFVQSNVYENVTTVLASPYNMAFEDPYKTRRLEVQNMSAEDLIRILNEYAPGPANYKLTSENFTQILEEKTSGELSLSENSQVVINAPIVGSNGLFSIGQPFWRNYSVSLDIQKTPSRSVAVLLNYVDWSNYIVCGYTDNSYFLREIVNGVTTDISPDLESKEIAVLEPENIEASSDFGTVSCGSKTNQVFKDVKTTSISGGSGVLTWDDKIQANIEIKNFEVTQK